MIVQNGKPLNLDGRIIEELESYQFLESLEIPFTQVDHQPAMTMEACVEIDKVLDTAMCKNLLVCNRQETNFYLVMLPGTKTFKTKFFSKALNIARVSFAKEEYLEKYLHLKPGSLTIMGLMYDTNCKVQLVIDRDILKNDSVGIHPCINTSSIKISTDDLLHQLIPALKHEPIFIDLETEE